MCHGCCNTSSAKKNSRAEYKNCNLLVYVFSRIINCLIFLLNIIFSYWMNETCFFLLLSAFPKISWSNIHNCFLKFETLIITYNFSRNISLFAIPRERWDDWDIPSSVKTNKRPTNYLNKGPVQICWRFWWFWTYWEICLLMSHTILFF